jgi:hypothetical protein
MATTGTTLRQEYLDVRKRYEKMFDIINSERYGPQVYDFFVNFAVGMLLALILNRWIGMNIVWGILLAFALFFVHGLLARVWGWRYASFYNAYAYQFRPVRDMHERLLRLILATVLVEDPLDSWEIHLRQGTATRSFAGYAIFYDVVENNFSARDGQMTIVVENVGSLAEVKTALRRLAWQSGL